MGNRTCYKQLEHGALSIIGGYKSLGRPLSRHSNSNASSIRFCWGDATNMTDNQVYDKIPHQWRKKRHRSACLEAQTTIGFLPRRIPNVKLEVAAGLAATSRPLRVLNRTPRKRLFAGPRKSCGLLPKKKSPRPRVGPRRRVCSLRLKTKKVRRLSCQKCLGHHRPFQSRRAGSWVDHSP